MFSLAALAPTPDGGILSEGLALFTSQELRLGSDPEGGSAPDPKIALRLAHWLVEHGRLTETQVVTGPDGRALRLTPSSDYHLVNAEQL